MGQAQDPFFLHHVRAFTAVYEPSLAHEPWAQLKRRRLTADRTLIRRQNEEEKGAAFCWWEMELRLHRAYIYTYRVEFCYPCWWSLYISAFMFGRRKHSSNSSGENTRARRQNDGRFYNSYMWSLYMWAVMFKDWSIASPRLLKVKTDMPPLFTSIARNLQQHRSHEQSIIVGSSWGTPEKSERFNLSRIAIAYGMFKKGVWAWVWNWLKKKKKG